MSFAASKPTLNLQHVFEHIVVYHRVVLPLVAIVKQAISINLELSSFLLTVQQQVRASDCLTCSILNLIFCNMVFGAIAVAFSCMARDAYDRG